ncbi:hypothetical protein Tsp_10166, partial [Trichinella spiralis]|uniref:hypothetical protein n=1 Tax=Trichinella spiralis TaxID=6334 RepID=UPI0001EFDBC1
GRGKACLTCAVRIFRSKQSAAQRRRDTVEKLGSDSPPFAAEVLWFCKFSISCQRFKWCNNSVQSLNSNQHNYRKHCLLKTKINKHVNGGSSEYTVILSVMYNRNVTGRSFLIAETFSFVSVVFGAIHILLQILLLHILLPSPSPFPNVLTFQKPSLTICRHLFSTAHYTAEMAQVPECTWRSSSTGDLEISFHPHVSMLVEHVLVGKKPSHLFTPMTN